MGLSARLIVGGVAAGTALAYYVRRRHSATGEAYLDIIAQLPAAAHSSVAHVKRRAALALEDGRAAARAREDDFTRQLEAAGSATTFDLSPYRGS
jgi:hypothetical protein